MTNLLGRGAWLAFAATLALTSVARTQPCDFGPVKEQIDIILDRDSARGDVFRKEIKAGADSIAIMEALVSPEMRKQIDICRYYAGEYLTKRGFPPFH